MCQVTGVGKYVFNSSAESVLATLSEPVCLCKPNIAPKFFRVTGQAKESSLKTPFGRSHDLRRPDSKRKHSQPSGVIETLEFARLRSGMAHKKFSLYHIKELAARRL
jgi:hypothetical protein